MNIGTFFIVAVTSSFVAFIWQYIFNVFPAQRSALIAECLAVLAKCVTKINREALLNSRIRNGHYLHDRLYKSLFCVLTHKVNLKINMLGHVKYDDETEKERRKFRKEIDSLDEETRKLINNAIFSMAKILLVRNPLVFILLCAKSQKVQRDFKSKNLKCTIRNRMITSVEYMTIKANKDDYLFAPC
jgi:hypothetical protein